MRNGLRSDRGCERPRRFSLLLPRHFSLTSILARSRSSRFSTRSPACDRTDPNMPDFPHQPRQLPRHHRRAWRDVLSALVLLLLGATPALAATLTRGPYLQLLTTESVTIVWNTDVAGGVRARDPSRRRRRRRRSRADRNRLRDSGRRSRRRARRTRTRRSPTACRSRPSRSSAPTIRARRSRSSSIGDYGCGAPHQTTRSATACSRRPADFILSTGDMIYERGGGRLQSEVLRPLSRSAPRARLLAAASATTTSRTGGGQPWRDAFYTPANNAAASENYYSFDFGNAHVVGARQQREHQPRERAVHVPRPGPGRQHGDVEVRRVPPLDLLERSRTVATTPSAPTCVPLFDAHGVDVVFMGHDHDYERTHPLDRRPGRARPGQGTVYVTTGGGGRELYPVGQSASPPTPSRPSTSRAWRWTAAPCFCDMIRADGTIGDTLTIAKGAGPDADLRRRSREPAERALRRRRSSGVLRRAATPDCTCAPVCGDGVVDPATEDCDGAATAACPDLCLAELPMRRPRAVPDARPGRRHLHRGGHAGDVGSRPLRPSLKVDESPADVTYLRFDLCRRRPCRSAAPR